jgi:excinuclease ABC subunit A
LAAIELAPPRAIAGDRLVIRGASANNLGDIDVEIPLAALVVLCGPSGSGKSTLADGILHRAIARARGENDVDAPLAHRTIEGIDRVARVVLVDQSPLGRTSRGNAATYSGCWTRFRQLFAAEPHALLRDLGPSHFSFNVAAGRCEACAGEGAETVEMQFLADVRLTCPACQGKRFRSDVLEVRLDGRSVADVMSMSIGEVIAWIGEREPTIARALLPLDRLGLGYLTLGQPLSTLSGGEAQRLKLARAMAEASAGTLLILDEPSAGLHANEVGCVVAALRQLVADGASVVVVDHDAAIIAAADWAIELGPGAGIDGGRLVFAGSPIDLAGGSTRTGRALAAAHRAVPQNGAHVDASRAAPRRAPHESRADAITVLGAREHNLADVAVRIPRGKLVVVTGPSGSGKSSLAFDVVFAEGQRRFLETLTPYARQFLPTMPRPDVDQVHGLPPSVALEQRTARAGASSTVATVTEIAHYLRLLYAKVGVAHCPDCDLPVEPAAADTVLRRLQAMRGDRILLAPIVRARKGTHYDVFTLAEQAGIEIAWVDGEPVRTDKPPRLAKTKEHTIELVVHTGNMRAIDRAVVSRALELGRGHLVVTHGKGERTLFSTARACSGCGRAVPELDPRWFSFNTAQGRCESCEGTGLRGGVEAARAIVRGSVDDAVTPGALEPCPSCDGSRLAPIPRAVRLAGERYHQHLALSVTKMAERVAAFSFEGAARTIAKAPLAELARRLRFVERVGLGYLTLDRRAQTLSGGEMQRLRLAAQLGSGLTGALYVLDEPTIGLHPRDTGRLLDNLRTLRDTGSTVLVVEHDAETIKAADHLIDLGPGGGRRGGRIVAEGPPAVVLASDASPTARAFRNAMRDPTRMPIGGEAEAIVLRSVRANNLRVDRLAIPSKRMCVVAGVSGSGKSTLVSQVLFPAARRALGLTGGGHNPTATIVLPRDIARVIAVDQSPIGRTSRSVPATFLGVWDPLRKLFAATSEARARGFRPARFSFNSASAGGRCSACDGLGVIGHEMAFLPDVETTCQSCNGMRFEPTTLDARWQGLSIGEILRLTVEEAAALFRAHRAIARPLETLCDLGVGYVQLGQGSPTLSGGEAQRLKLAAELTASGRHRPTLYVLDEPTTGLHHSDVARLISVLDALVRRGDSLVIIEHHPSVIAAADWVIELGPEGGDAGGRVVAEGSPAAIALGNTATGQVLGQVVPPKVGTQRTHA